jgi:exosortase
MYHVSSENTFAPAPSSVGAFRWRLAVAFVLVVCLYGAIARDLVHDWWYDEGASYGFVIPPIAIALTWVRRHALRATHPYPDGRGLLILTLACLMLVGGHIGADFFFMRLSFIVLLAGLLATFWGFARLRVLAFPLAVLATMIPLPGLLYTRIAIPLQLLASEAATSVVRHLGGSIYREGNILQLPGLTLGVAEACSGLRSISALSIVALLMGFTHCRTAVGRWLVFAFAIPLAIALNVLRVSGTVLLASVNENFAMGFYHSFSGWVVFLVSSVIMFYLAKGLNLLWNA